MGTSFSRLRLALQALRNIDAAYKELSRRINLSPGLPVAEPSIPYWAIPASSIAQHGSEEKLPPYADVVVIGSGITGTAFARTLLDSFELDCKDVAPQVVMLEARDACSGATARNGGHITPLLYHDYPELKEKHGIEMANSIVRFRLAHLGELIRVGEEENILADSQCREVETFDVFYDQQTLDGAIQNLAAYLDDMPDQAGMWRVIGAEECTDRLQLSEQVVGAIATTAGSIHPYRFVTGILSRLLNTHSKNFHLFTHTPCISISSPSSSKGEQLYTLLTNKGTIRAPHIIHATNAWTSHLLPPMRGKIIPTRGHMSAQRPGMGLGAADVVSACHTPDRLPPSPNDSVLTLADSDPAKKQAVDSWLGTRSFVMYSQSRYDYLTQQPRADSLSACSTYPPPAAEFMLGGGARLGEATERAFMSAVGITDDSSSDMDTSSYLSGALSVYFSGWGPEGRNVVGNPMAMSSGDRGEGRVMKLWTGIMGISADGLPWVGKLPAKISGRPAPRATTSSKHQVAERQSRTFGEFRLAAPGEWISAGYSGEGMVNAFMSGKALAQMVLGLEPLVDTAELPGAFLITEARWKKANVENFVMEFAV